MGIKSLKHWLGVSQLGALGVLILTGLVSCCLCLTPAKVAAVSDSQIVEVVVPAHALAISITTPLSPYKTTNANFDMVLIANGIGVVTITDQNYNVLWTYNKTTDGQKTLTASVSLVGDPGSYFLTAQIVNSDLSPSSASSTLTVEYQATVIVPPVIPDPGLPNTGLYLKVLGRAVSFNQLLSLTIFVAPVVGLLTWLIVFRRRQQRARAEVRQA